MLRIIFVLLILVPGVIAALQNRYAALLLYLWFALFRPQDWIWFDVSSLHVSLIAGLILVVPSLVSGVWPNVTHPLSVGSILFLLSAVLAQYDAVQSSLSWMWIDYFARLLLISLLAIKLIDTPRRFVLAIAVISGSFGFHAAKAGLASVLGGGLRFSEGLAGAFVDNNGYALGTVMILFLLVAAAQNIQHRWARLALYAAVPLSTLTVISTFSRAGFLALAASIVVYVALQRRRIGFGLSLAGMIVLGLLMAPIPEGYAERLDTIQNYQQLEDPSALGRTHFWSVAVDMALDRPLGVGLRNYEAAYDQYDFSGGRFGQQRSVHSSHLEVLAETGFVGAAVYTGLFAYAIYVALRVRARSRRPSMPPQVRYFLFTSANALLASMVGFLVGGAFIALALNDLTWLTFALVAALDRLSQASYGTDAAAPPVQAPGLAAS
jgi:putative inorganic carbon (HCO3(-)) transporter